MIFLSRLSSPLGYLFLAAVLSAYLVYAGIVLYFNNVEFFFTPELKPEPNPAVSRIEIFIAPSTVKVIDQVLWPQEARRYHRLERVVIDGKTYDASMEVRGWEKHHWQGDFNSRRRSWRIRLRGDERYRGMKTINLRRFEFPTYLHGHLPFRIATELGLFAPITDVVQVDWNGTTYGLMTLWEQLEEGFGETHGRPPGLIFSERYTQGVYDLWTHPRPRGKEDEHWRTYPDTPPDETWEPLRKLLATLHIKDDGEFLKEIQSIIDLEQFIRVMAFWNLGGVYHQNSHNIRLLYRPDEERFEWILWDIAGFHYTVRAFSYSAYMEDRYPLDGCPNLLTYRLLKIPEITEKRNEILWRFIREDIPREKFKALIDGEAARIREYVRSEKSRIYPYRYFLRSQEKFKGFVDKRYDLIEGELNNLKVGLKTNGGNLDLEVDGQSGFRLMAMEAPDLDATAEFHRDINGNGLIDPEDEALHTQREGSLILFPDEPLFLPARRDIPRIGPDPLLHEKSLEPAPALHRLFVTSPAAEGINHPSGKIIQIRGRNSVTGKAVEVSPTESRRDSLAG